MENTGGNEMLRVLDKRVQNIGGGFKSFLVGILKLEFSSVLNSTRLKFHNFSGISSTLATSREVLTHW